MDALGGRTGVWQVFDDHPGASDVNIKFGSVRLVHDVNIITRVTPYPEFFNGLAGDYTDRSGVRHHAEDARQSWGRFPFVTEVTENSFSFLVNQGFVDDTAEFKAFKKVATMRASFKQIGRALDSIEDSEEREKAMYQVGDMLLRPMLDHHDSLQPKPTHTKDAALASLMPSLGVYTDDALEENEAGLATDAAAASEEAGLIAAREWGSSRYVEHFQESHLQGVDTPEPGFICGGCTDATEPN